MRILRIKIETVSFSEQLLTVLFCDVFDTIVFNSFSGCYTVILFSRVKKAFGLVSFEDFLFCVCHKSGPIYLFKDSNLPRVSWFIVTHVQLSSIFFLCFT
jgi:hypothetical protein